jgi:hypothetical protein
MKMKITDITGGSPVAPIRKAVVIPLNNVTKLDIPADRVLEGAMGNLDGVVIMGRQPDGEYYFASSIADGGTVLWMMEKLKLKLMGVE